MKTVVVKDYNEMSVVATDLIVEVMQSKPDCVLGLATGSTPEGLYDNLAMLCAAGKLDFSRVRTVNLDEYYPISPENDQSYRYFMNTKLFDRVNIDKANTYVPDGMAKDPDAACLAHEAVIDALGGQDIQVLGIGQNGHIGFNEPSDEAVPFTHREKLTESTIKANSRFFESEDDVPKEALTMGIQSILKAKKIIVLASGKSKAQAVRGMLLGDVTPRCPASLLRDHPDVVVIADEEAMSLC
jgi:glucosamine-6-phosphate deaminase